MIDRTSKACAAGTRHALCVGAHPETDMQVATFAEVVEIPAGTARLGADLRVPPRAQGLVIFAHGSGSSRFSVRNRRVADSFHDRGFATLLADLLTSHEESLDFY